MPHPRTIAALAVAVTLAGVFGLTLSGPASASDGVPPPAHVFAPYFEAWTGDDPATIAKESGAKYLTMAFIQTASQGSCTAYWNGVTSQPLDASTFGSSIDAIRAAGGDVIPSFGGFTADDTGTDIADSCTNVNSIAAVYEKVVTTYGVARIDLDTEDSSLTNMAGIDRRNKAIKVVEDWAAAQGRPVQFVYSLPSTTTGLAASGLTVLQNAVTNHAAIRVVNIMTFDYYDGATHEMATDTETAADGLHAQLQTLYPSSSSARLWSMIGVTDMPGIDDFGPAETFTTADGPTVEKWAAGKGIAELSMWASQRDNGGCPGTKGSNSCSGDTQSTWQFSHAFEPFTGGASAPPPTTSPSHSASPSPSAAPSPSRSAAPSPSHSMPPSPTPSRSTSPKPSTSATPPPSGGIVANGGFESGSLGPWTCSTTTGRVISSPVHSGSHALRAAPTDADDAICTQTITVAPNHAYTLSAYVRGDFAFIGTEGGSADNSTWVSAPGYTQLSVAFTSGASTQMEIWVHGWYVQGPIDVDDVTVHQ
jgi:carbohydrate binding protein with CBM4/9 domain/glycosyl hydrolase family 18 (putative chitinase)